MGKVRQRVDVWKLRAIAGGGTHAKHKQYTTSVEGGTNFPNFPRGFAPKLREAKRAKIPATSQKTKRMKHRNGTDAEIICFNKNKLKKKIFAYEQVVTVGVLESFPLI